MWSNHRLPSRLEPTPFADRLERLEREAGAELLDLTFSNPSRGFEEHRRKMSEHLREAAERLTEVPYSPDPQGLEGAREAVVGYYADRGAEIGVEQLCLAASTSEAYSWLAKILADPGDQILIPSPSYPLFEHLLSLEVVETVPYRFRREGKWHLDTGDLRRQLGEADRPAAIFAVSPNNPTGHVLSDGDLGRLEKLARDHEVPLVVDEVFLDFGVEGAPPGSVLARDRDGATLENRDGAKSATLENRGGAKSATEQPLTFVLGGLSKAAGVPGAKLGWVAVDGPGEQVETARERLAFVGDTFLSASTVTQLAVPDILTSIEPFHREVRERLATNLEALDEALEAVGAASRHPVEAGWYAIVRMPSFIDEADLVVALLEEHQTLVQPGFFYDLEPDGHLVVSLLCDEAAFEEGVERLMELVAERLAQGGAG